MLREMLTSLRTDAVDAARRLGLSHEHAAIAARFSRVGAHWEPHLSACRETILEGANRCSSFRRAFVVGAGDCRDVPVRELVEKFETTVLADVVCGPAARALARRFSGRVVCLPWDATGALNELATRRATISPDEAVDLFETSSATPPAGGEPDLVVSANCLSQLGLIPTHTLSIAKESESLVPRAATAAAQSHLRWLRQRPAVRVLIGDTARLDVSPDGRILRRENLMDCLDLRPPDRTWRWHLAPIPEVSREFHRVHEIGAWID